MAGRRAEHRLVRSRAALAARSALVFDGGAAGTKRGGWFFASPGRAHTRTHPWREMERKEEGEQGRDTELKERGAGKERVGRADQD